MMNNNDSRLGHCNIFASTKLTLIEAYEVKAVILRKLRDTCIELLVTLKLKLLYTQHQIHILYKIRMFILVEVLK